MALVLEIYPPGVDDLDFELEGRATIELAKPCS